MKRIPTLTAAAFAAVALAGCAAGQSIELSMETTGKAATATVTINGVVETLEISATQSHGIAFNGSIDDIDEFKITGNIELTCTVKVDGETVALVTTDSTTDAETRQAPNPPDAKGEVVCVPTQDEE